MNVPGLGEMPQLESSYTITVPRNNGPSVSVEIVRFRGTLPRLFRDAMEGAAGGRFGGGEVKNVRWLGGSGIEMRVGGDVIRQVFTDKAMVSATVHGGKPEEIDAFFSNFELTK
jgi:hypothetical protein